ncbi:hypothetical protein ASE66_09870 [Bosea sp. Root483D1]|uniref:DUF2939 domain-containing protein n=1 Tax=Bosea sp. Root483D1 TaxID=1736544 RepID=UPI000708EC31|nr:DUF2939 domain-containing protein [Bosea sp. Root483D1]KRE16068.1 hypothetical protein ASE66_09870 [Bosea sp. Root483D1]
MVQSAIDDEDDEEIGRRRPRWRLRIALGVTAAVLIGYWLSPYASAARLALAANAGSTEDVLARTDLPALRAFFARQIVRTYMARQPQTRSLDPLARQIVGGVATGYVDAIIAEHLTPQAVAALISARGAAAPPAGVLGQGVALPSPDLQGAWTLFTNSGFDGPASFAVELPVPGEANAERYRLRFGLVGLRWMLRAVELPRSALEKLADELKARTDRGA